MIAEAIQGHFLLSHQLDGPLIHLGVMNADAAEDGKGLKERDIRLFEGRSIILQCSGSILQYLGKNKALERLLGWI